jgi:hypothetical protein
MSKSIEFGIWADYECTYEVLTKYCMYVSHQLRDIWTGWKCEVICDKFNLL